MKIIPESDRPRAPGAPDNFTGRVDTTTVHKPVPPARVVSGLNTFHPGARTVWHTHPLGQVLYIVSGVGRVQVWGEPVREVRAGDTVYFPPGEKHWHGASPTEAMSHLSIAEMQDGRAVDWMEPVSEVDYNG